MIYNDLNSLLSVTFDMFEVENLILCFQMFSNVKYLILFGFDMISGWLYDTTGNYRVSFYTMGAILFTAGPMMLLLPVLKRVDIKRRGCEQ